MQYNTIRNFNQIQENSSIIPVVKYIEKIILITTVKDKDEFHFSVLRVFSKKSENIFFIFKPRRKKVFGRRGKFVNGFLILLDFVKLMPTLYKSVLQKAL